jgi:hypothetical protein
MAIEIRRRLKFGSNSAGAHNAPVGDGLENGEQPRDYQEQAPQRNIANHNARNQTNPAPDAAGHAPGAIQVWTEKSAHKTTLRLIKLL